jgi:hypothetical protein
MMTASAKSVYFFGLYLYIVGLTLIFVPHVFLMTLNLPESNDVWIRIVGVLAVLLGYYYHRTGAMNLTEFFKLTIPTRTIVFLSFTTFVLLKLTAPILVLVGAVDLAGAIWTWRSLKKEKHL